MKKEDQFTAIIVTYNNLNYLLKCINSLFNQQKKVNGLIVVDNHSSINTAQGLYQHKLIREMPDNTIHTTWHTHNQINGTNIHYIRLTQNTGGAGGFYNGVKAAIESNYNWLWLMDDDCLPLPDCLLNQSKNIKSTQNAYIPLVKGIKTNTPLYLKDWGIHVRQNTGTYIVNTGAFNGFLIHRNLVKEIGYPEKKFFLYGDDTDYSNKIKKNGGQIILISNAILYHPDKFSRFHLQIKKAFHKNTIYYGIRNKLWLQRKDKNIFLPSTWIKLGFMFLLFSLFRWDLLKLLLKAIHDARHNKLGKNENL